jgi:predicted DNA-binding transcriptional regulator AlpA
VTAKANRTQPVLSSFDELPDAAFVPISVPCALLHISATTAWRWVRAGKLPKPAKFGEGTTRINVGQLRAAIRAIAGERGAS